MSAGSNTGPGESALFICVECGGSSDQKLHKEFTGGAIQLSQCTTCGKVLDKYVEFDAVILLLDVLLLRIQSYRHLIFNYGISSSILWKFSVVLVLCEAYTKLQILNVATSDSTILQIHFHTLFLQSILEFLWLLVCTYVLIKLLARTSSRTSFIDVYRTVVISSFGKLCAVGAMVWTGDFYLWLPPLLVLPAQLQAFRALLNIGMPRAAAIVLIQYSMLHGLSIMLAQGRMAALYQMGLVKAAFLPNLRV